MLTRPMILLLDNEATARDAMREAFDAVNCSVIAVGTEESALEEIDARQDIDVIVTDVNLRTGNSDKSGVIFAKMVRQLRQDVPIAGYSGRAKDLKLTPNELRNFELFLDKEHGDVGAFVHECKAYAVTHREMAGKLLGKISSRRSQNFDTMSALEDRLNLLEKNAIKKSDIKGVLSAANIMLGIIAGIASIVGLYFAWLALRNA